MVIAQHGEVASVTQLLFDMLEVAAEVTELLADGFTQKLEVGGVGDVRRSAGGID